MLRDAYQACLSRLEGLPQTLDTGKTLLAELHAIHRKRPLWRTVAWTAQQQAEFDR